MKKILSILGIVFVVICTILFFILDKSGEEDLEIPPIVNTEGTDSNVTPNSDLYEGEDDTNVEETTKEDPVVDKEEPPVVDKEEPQGDTEITGSADLYVPAEEEEEIVDMSIPEGEEPEPSTVEQGLFEINLEFENAITFCLKGADKILEGTCTEKLKAFRESVDSEYPYSEFPEDLWMQDGGGNFEEGTYYIVWEDERYDFTFTVENGKLDTITYMPVEG